MMSEDRGFVIKDRRAEGDPPREHRIEAEAKQTDSSSRSAEHHTAIDFSTFLLSLGTSILVHLGEAPQADGEHGQNLPLAKQTIEIIALLKEKTTGNLTVDEQKLIDELLYDCKVRYVAAAK